MGIRRIIICILLAGVFSCLTWARATAAPQPIRLTRAAIKLHEGDVWGHWGQALICNLAPEELRWKSDQSELNTKRFSEVFDEELTAAGLRQSRVDSLFDEAPTAGLQLGVAIISIDAQICSSSDDDYGTNRTFRGKMTMGAEWQVYDPVRAQIIARISTTAAGEQKNRSRDGVERIAIAAFRASARQLIASEAFRKLASGPATAAPTVSYAPLTLVPAAAASLPVSGALASVATIFAGDGWGSGFLISPEGFLLTNRHVVGDARQVRVRWSDGSETVGDVTRSDARRDVALVKADPHGRGALPLRLDEAQPGEAVVAIGTPLEKTFQSTVTKGVISGIRTLEGLAFVQSDVAVDHGNSGGPLLDEHGRVLAITDWGYAPDGVSHNLNFFIPIDDALRALALTETAEPMGAVPPSARVSARRTR